MGFFDRFRAQPKWKHADPAVRLAAIEEIPLEEQGLLATLAHEDADARVRRAAVRKLYDPAVLDQVSEHDQDAAVREEASTVLVDLALGAFEDSNESESLKALEHLRDARHLVTVAKEASAEAVSLAALGRITDAKTIGSVARRSAHAATRMEALGRIGHAPEEIFATALKADHRDVAAAALEQMSDREQIRAVATKSSHKAVVRRARAMLKAIEDAEQARAAAVQAAAKAAPPARNIAADRDRVSRTVEQVQGERSWQTIESGIAAAETEWQRLDAESAANATQTARFEAALHAARAAAARLKQEEAARSEQAEQAERQQAQRVDACRAIEELASAVSQRVQSDEAPDTAWLDEMTARVAEARTAWATLETPAVDGMAAERLERRFERACEGADREVERARNVRASRQRLQELATEAEALAAEAPGGENRKRWNALAQEWADLGGARIAGQSAAERFEAAQASATRREAEAREQERQRQQAELQRAARACEQIEAVAKAETLTLKDGERALRDAKAALEAMGALGRKDRVDIAERLKAAQALLFPRVHELREADEWERWANVGIQEQLCAKAEALRDVADPAEAARELRDLQQQWKRAAAAPRDKAKGLWERFKKAGDDVHARAEAHFAEQAAERTQNLARKEELCQQAEALADSTEWVKTAEAIKQLQSQWTAIGPVPRGHEKAVWERFRAACDRFFTRRREDLNKRKEEWAANQAKKEALIAQVEALVASSETATDWGRAVEDVKRLQAEWKGVGPVRRTRSEELWQRFRGACDQFFERYQQRDQLQVAANVAAREAICSELEALMPVATEGAEPAEQPSPDSVRSNVQALRMRWQQAPTVMPRDTMATLTTRFNDAIAAVRRAFPQAFQGSDLDIDSIRRRAEALCERVEKALPSEPEHGADESPASILAARLREALAANTIGGVAVADQGATWRAATTTVKEAQAAWTSLNPLPAEIADTLGPRFERACKRFFDAAEKRKK